MDVPIDVDVLCTDGYGGRSTSILLNPLSMEVTHVVVRSSGEELLVPLDLVQESSSRKILLNCTQQELSRQERFVKMQFLGTEEFDVENDLRRMAAESDANYWPYRTIDDNYLEIYGKVEQIPHNELAIHRGSLVEASDGHVGHKNISVILNRSSGSIHLANPLTAPWIFAKE